MGRVRIGRSRNIDYIRAQLRHWRSTEYHVSLSVLQRLRNLQSLVATHHNNVSALSDLLHHGEVEDTSSEQCSIYMFSVITRITVSSGLVFSIVLVSHYPCLILWSIQLQSHLCKSALLAVLSCRVWMVPSFGFTVDRGSLFIRLASSSASSLALAFPSDMVVLSHMIDFWSHLHVQESPVTPSSSPMIDRALQSVDH